MAQSQLWYFVTGGAWIIGYKAWGSLLGLQLAERDIIVACIDYRNFPQGTISDMVKDVSQGSHLSAISLPDMEVILTESI
ncbi:probable isoprenylcysteine alpha-carbonyl methylesterase ICMEL2 [Hibiscus syriacus]|uniref:probable isoprenylcysteine alpha-carbonyl methylesterase ICMEL2 n=1 Tax=Hibiscus syriacus TaxID=106335 RepID=UPI001920CCEF|nr:probable isoprenylcysteine alpha-carbonyl methylesterase ICMEL2 [Hibiscus syriacus]